MAETMRSVLFYGPKDIRFEERPVPTPGPGEAVLRIKAALTCGTDFKAYRQGHKVLLAKTPSPFGHEMAGLIESVDPGVSHLKPGDRVVAVNSAPCDLCFFCQRGETELCDRLDLLNGAYAEYIKLPAAIVKHNTHVLPASLDFSLAALAEPFACALHAAHKLAVKPGDTVALLGLGNMGRLVILALREKGVRVLALGRNAERLRMAKDAGADEIIDLAKENDMAVAVRKRTHGRGADAVVEAVGKPEVWGQVPAMVRKGGQVCFFGGCAAGSRADIDTHRLHYDELTLFGVFHHRPEFVKQAVALLAVGKLRRDLFIQGRLSLEEIVPYFKSRADSSPLKTEVIP